MLSAQNKTQLNHNSLNSIKQIVQKHIPKHFIWKYICHEQQKTSLRKGLSFSLTHAKHVLWTMWICWACGIVLHVYHYANNLMRMTTAMYIRHTILEITSIISLISTLWNDCRSYARGFGVLAWFAGSDASTTAAPTWMPSNSAIGVLYYATLIGLCTSHCILHKHWNILNISFLHVIGSRQHSWTENRLPVELCVCWLLWRMCWPSIWPTFCMLSCTICVCYVSPFMLWISSICWLYFEWNE